MDVQFTEIKLIELFVEVDDLYKAFLEYKKNMGQPPLKSTRQTQLVGSEVCTILAAYHYSGYKCFEYYYREMILKRYAGCFPDAPTYERFVSLIPRAADLIYLWLLYSVARSKRTGLYFIDSKKLQVCHLKREHSNRVFKEVAAKGKTSTGWFFGLKIHLVINNLGEIVSFDLTPGNVADNNQSLLIKLLNSLDGRCVGDKGYFSKLFSFFFENGLHLITKPKKNMKKLPVDNNLNLLINKRAVVESVFDILGTICDVEHSRHRSPLNASIHIFSALIAYQYMEEKPRVFFPSRLKKLRLAA
jgi:hypothetical protein